MHRALPGGVASSTGRAAASQPSRRHRSFYSQLNGLGQPCSRRGSSSALVITPGPPARLVARRASLQGSYAEDDPLPPSESVLWPQGTPPPLQVCFFDAWRSVCVAVCVRSGSAFFLDGLAANANKQTHSCLPLTIIVTHAHNTSTPVGARPKRRPRGQAA
jgi:hypothetical protein